MINIQIKKEFKMTNNRKVTQLKDGQMI
jgi:hypothetical protein